MATKIEWTTETWNPIAGCTKISEGCQNCYAEKMAYRLAHMINAPHMYQHIISDSGKWTGLAELHYPALEKPLQWKKPKMIFVCSMGDLFHESVDFNWIIEVFHIIKKCPQHTFQILTKRVDRMYEFFNDFAPNPYCGKNIPENIWLGVTAENQKQANNRLPVLIKIPAKIKFVSVEPMLGNINISVWLYSGYLEPPHDDIINWVICGGENGPKARPMHPDWVHSLRDQCLQANVPFFFKSWGEFTHSLVDRNGECQFFKVGKKTAGNLIDGKQYNQFPV